ncbi:DUF411 domain-containing protein [Idiomarina sp. PL1-037]|uniref:DUF411 domain-containing protein n=1 Tax=Idiomarina sp. PL1-037 TaxID=3095365 RepID=UPI002ACC2E6A|nr:DUF411 domain-containing protein [Idiomarina sp. PL1-037]WQC53650.1 DUF411 domain-containing protein [Idiomarina sp. PL1-037]
MSIKRNSAILAMLFSVSMSVAGAEEQLRVLKDPNCGCCEKWLKALPESLNVSVQHPIDLTQQKRQAGISADIQSCHTAISDSGFVFEGHVPPVLVSRYLEGDKSTNGIGLTVPGMPVGSVGMEMGSRFQPYTVYEVKKDGSIAPYQQVASIKQQKKLSGGGD